MAAAARIRRKAPQHPRTPFTHNPEHYDRDLMLTVLNALRYAWSEREAISVPQLCKFAQNRVSPDAATRILTHFEKFGYASRIMHNDAGVKIPLWWYPRHPCSK